MLLPPPNFLLVLLALSLAAGAVFRDEVGHLDYHHELVGLPTQSATFFHSPRADDPANLLYTLSDEGVLGALDPARGEVVWRQLLDPEHAVSTAGRKQCFARAGEGQDWIVSALGSGVHSWDAVSGRNKFWVDMAGGQEGETAKVVDLEVMAMADKGVARKDVLALVQEGQNGATVLRRLDADDGTLVWEFRDATDGVPLQVSSNVDKVFVVGLRGSHGSYSLRITVLDAVTGNTVDEVLVGAKGDVPSVDHVIFVGANSAAPVVAWTDEARSLLRVHVLGTRAKLEFSLPLATAEVAIHAPHSTQSMPHFLAHIRTKDGNQAEVYHIDLKTNAVTRAYKLPLLPGPGAFSASSDGANVYFVRIAADETILYSSASQAILGRWPLKMQDQKGSALHAACEVIKRPGRDHEHALRSAAVTDADNWVLIRNGELAWTRPEGLTGALAAAFAEIPESEDFAETLKQEAHGNPLEAVVLRVYRHVTHLAHLPVWLSKVFARLVSSFFGTDPAAKHGKLGRDSFGFHKLVVLATRRGRLYGLDVGSHGKTLWSVRVGATGGQDWHVKGMQVDNAKGQVTVRGGHGELVTVQTATGKTVESRPEGTDTVAESTALVDSPSGPWLLPIGPGGSIGPVLSNWAPEQTVVVRTPQGGLRGVVFERGATQATATTSWIFAVPKGQRIVHIATRPSHDTVASIGRVLGDRTVKYKYLNPNTLVVAAANDAESALSVYLLDTVSGQILAAATHEGIDTDKPVECAMVENWYLCSFFGHSVLRDNPSKTLQGYQITVSDLYESPEANDRGPLGDAANFSSIGPLHAPTSASYLPSVVTQTFVLADSLSALQVTQTRQGISSRQLLAYVPDAHAIVAFPRQLLEPRRPVGRDPTPAEQEEGLIKYFPVIETDPKSVITHLRDVLGVRKILTTPTTVESTSLVFAYGLDVFGTRVAPSFQFDILGKAFNKVALIGTVAALAAGVLVLRPIVRRKQINVGWKAPI